jgi:hypothetical protein
VVSGFDCDGLRTGWASAADVQLPWPACEDVSHEGPQLLGRERLAENGHVTGELRLNRGGGPVDVGDIKNGDLSRSIEDVIRHTREVREELLRS